MVARITRHHPFTFMFLRLHKEICIIHGDNVSTSFEPKDSVKNKNLSVFKL